MIPLPLAALLLSAQPAAAPPGPAQGATIVVRGERIGDLRRALRECLARNCPPNEDIDAATALAEAMFLNGRHGDARTVVRDSLGRNRGAARDYPEPVSELNRAYGRLSRQLGYDREARMAARNTLRALQAGLPVEDHRHFTARLELTQSLLAFSRYRELFAELDELEEKAREAGRDDVVAAAQLRRLWASYLAEPTKERAEQRLLAMTRSRDARRAIGARMLLVRIYGETRRRAEAEAMIAELGRTGGRRQLLYNPPFRLNQRSDESATHARTEAIELGGPITATLTTRLTGNYYNRWLEVGFWIRQDGSVEGLEIVRQSDRAGWADPLLSSIRGRRYAASTEAEPSYRLERYTYTSELDDSTRVRRHTGAARLEYFDLTDAATAPAG